MANTPMRIGVAGIGTVGSSILRIINEKQVQSGNTSPLRVTGIHARSKNKKRNIDISNYTWFDDVMELATSPEIDIFVELIGGDGDPALASVKSAIEAGKHVVTANKALLSKHGVELAKLADQKGVSLNYEAAVAGGIPIIKTLREAMKGNEISRVYGILNGTCNYILTEMDEKSLSFDECLAEAQALGYAEADPTFDIEGYDAAHKLSILTSLCFGTEISPFDLDTKDVYVEGIKQITLADINAANALGYKIKLLGVALKTPTGIEQRVHPTMVLKESSIAQVDGVLNAVALDADNIGQLMLVGPGAGGNATASAVYADLSDIANGISQPTLGRPSDQLQSFERARMQAHEGGYYIRLLVKDQPGAFAAIATCMGEQDISLESIVQHKLGRRRGGEKEVYKDGIQPVILITHQTTEKQVKAALQKINEDGFIEDDPRMIRIEHF